jgi:hypothetical protein
MKRAVKKAATHFFLKEGTIIIIILVTLPIITSPTETTKLPLEAFSARFYIEQPSNK